MDDHPGAAPDCPRLQQIGLRLARAGNDLFQLLFHNGDPGMKEIGEVLLRHTRDGDCAMSIESDDLFVPWNLLYTPPSGDDPRVWSSATSGTSRVSGGISTSSSTPSRGSRTTTAESAWRTAR
ncbi:hypothetical protein AB0I77_27665 [Streptomyces sp. NPDC050619]|uniref:hypothetical protein n=1 Tax=Streptomyces sp. NPDC050619 TaxID=3157214 RepID=UPI00342ADCFD